MLTKASQARPWRHQSSLATIYHGVMGRTANQEFTELFGHLTGSESRAMTQEIGMALIGSVRATILAAGLHGISAQPCWLITGLEGAKPSEAPRTKRRCIKNTSATTRSLTLSLYPTEL